MRCDEQHGMVAFAGDVPADRNPAKQGRYLPGSKIPIVDESVLRARRHRWVLILPWNLREEIIGQLAYVREWGGAFVTAVPALSIHR